ncbi:ribonuclease H1-like [Dreissena polymorpha]|uniref:ribonuclease H1-like n=1 Tax=Dreissena polymorpha TaxID=45954 RepID=UPI0022644F85|nr:ribonuclease H1-like [Dreissena polymorpha]
MTNEDFRSDLWTHVYTDGSATRAVEDGGAGIHIRYPSGRNETHFMATGKRCSNYKAETEALMKAASMIDNSPEDTTSVVFLTDARSVLDALINNTSSKLVKLMTRRSNNLNIAHQWIPAHCGVSGNEEADQLAKQGAKQSNQIPRLHTERKSPSSRQSPGPSKNKMLITCLTEQNKK